jgi:hypothetical protein
VRLSYGVVAMPPRMRALAYLHAKKQTCACLKYFEALVTISVGGVDIDVGLLVNLKRFLEENCIACLCLVEEMTLDAQAFLNGCQEEF